ncbi:MAG: DUF1801 domain-containing protein [Microscillaceae bacterium]|nr:DUF1801 domain-containing protein [Microscillaceae bacterium]
MEEELIFFIDRQEPSAQTLLWYLHRFISQQDEAIQVKIRYQLPFYYRKSWICYLNPLKKGGLELAFTRGNELADAPGLLDFRGRKQVSSVIFKHPEEVPEASLREILMEALWLDQHVAYTVKKQKE